VVHVVQAGCGQLLVGYDAPGAPGPPSACDGLLTLRHRFDWALRIDEAADLRRIGRTPGKEIGELQLRAQ